MGRVVKFRHIEPVCRVIPCYLTFVEVLIILTTGTSTADLQAYLEERPDVDVEAEVGEPGGDDLGPAVVSVLPHLGHQDPGTAALLRGKLLHLTGRVEMG